MVTVNKKLFVCLVSLMLFTACNSREKTQAVKLPNNPESNTIASTSSDISPPDVKDNTKNITEDVSNENAIEEESVSTASLDETFESTLTGSEPSNEEKTPILTGDVPFNGNSSDQVEADVELMPDEVSVTRQVIRATDYSIPVFLDLNTGDQVSEEDDWDLAFRRNTIMVNDNKKTAIADRQTTKFSGEGRGDTTQWSSDEVANIINATESTEEAAFLAISQLPEDEQYLNSDLLPAINAADLYRAIGEGGEGFDANNEHWFYLTNSAGNGYAQMNVSAFTREGISYKPYVAMIDFYIEDENGFSETVSNTWALDFAAQGETCYDFDEGVIANCNGRDYDLKSSVMGQEVIITLNREAKSAGPLGYIDATRVLKPLTQSSYSTGDHRNNRANPIFNSYNVDKKQNSFEDHAFYAYDPQGLGFHQLIPYFRTYLIDTDAASETDIPYKLQVLSYYNENNVSGYYTVRYVQLSEIGE